MSLRSLAGRALATADVDEELVLLDELVAAWRRGELAVGDSDDVLPATSRLVPDRPVLVDPRAVPSRGFGTVAGRIAAIHAVAHIEANAIDLALDAVHRFAGLPTAYYDDWVRVADEEATHFRLLRARLHDHGAEYGDLPAHGGLWDTAVRTSDDALRRMALVPRVLEARGLDANPRLIAGFDEAGDAETAAVLRRVLADEVGHVAIGDRWFRYLCAERGLEPEAAFVELLAEAGIRLRPPFNVGARLLAGFSERELQSLARP